MFPDMHKQVHANSGLLLSPSYSKQLPYFGSGVKRGIRLPIRSPEARFIQIRSRSTAKGEAAVRPEMLFLMSSPHNLVQVVKVKV